MTIYLILGLLDDNNEHFNVVPGTILLPMLNTTKVRLPHLEPFLNIARH
jgi:hypothetical protein